MEITSGKKTVIGFSGGVDSAVACLLLKEQGMEVHALYFDVDEHPDGRGASSALEAADKLGIELTCVNVYESFRDSVIEPFCMAYVNGVTPNPCVLCNPSVKFRVLSEYADKIGVRCIATGHYAQVEKAGGTYYVSRAANRAKDQSYMLCRLSQNILSRVIFPLGIYETKEEIRAIAEEHGLPNAHSKDSQDICFIPDGDHAAYLEKNGHSGRTGYFKDASGNVLGRHGGLHRYTVGQRKGLGIALGVPAFVKSIDPLSADIILSTNENDIFSASVMLEDVFFTDSDPQKYCGKDLSGLTAKLRYTKQEAACRLQLAENGAVLHFDEPQRAPAPGQEAVIYYQNKVIGCGRISTRQDQAAQLL